MNENRTKELEAASPSRSVARRLEVQTAHLTRAEFEALIRKMLAEQPAKKGD